MALGEDLQAGVGRILRGQWNLRAATVVPDTDSIALVGGGAEFEGTVLYSDLAQSSRLATDFQRRTAAKVIKAFLFATTKIVTASGGSLTSFDGDRVMGVFIGDRKNSNAATAALKINYAVSEIIRPRIREYFASMRESGFEVSHATGVDTSEVLAVRAGQRGSNDLIWVGRAPNLAARLCSIREEGIGSYISDDVFKKLSEDVKYDGSERKLMWESRSYSDRGENWSIHRSSWTWNLA